MIMKQAPEQKQMDQRIEQSDQDAIQRRAFQLYSERGERQGGELEDWLQAEREVRGINQQRQHQSYAM
jgi:hypothetical protein